MIRETSLLPFKFNIGVRRFRSTFVVESLLISFFLYSADTLKGKSKRVYSSFSRCNSIWKNSHVSFPLENSIDFIIDDSFIGKGKNFAD